jgi:hypothetical protein
VYRRFPGDWQTYHTRYVTPQSVLAALRGGVPAMPSVPSAAALSRSSPPSNTDLVRPARCACAHRAIWAANHSFIYFFYFPERTEMNETPAAPAPRSSPLTRVVLAAVFACLLAAAFLLNQRNSARNRGDFSGEGRPCR